MKEQTRTLAIVNDSQILLIENGEKLVPMKPICEALGIGAQAQIEKVEEDEILKSTVRLSLAVGADGKQREMKCIPYKYVFGWLFTINPKNVKPEAQEIVTKYKMMCYDVLYRHFTDHSAFLEQKQELVNIELDEYQKTQQEFRSAKEKLADRKKRLNKIREMSFDEWIANNRQMRFSFIDENKEEA